MEYFVLIFLLKIKFVQVISMFQTIPWCIPTVPEMPQDLKFDSSLLEASWSEGILTETSNISRAEFYLITFKVCIRWAMHILNAKKAHPHNILISH